MTVGFGACSDAGMEITWLGARQLFSSSSDNAIVITTHNDGLRLMRHRAGGTEPESSFLSTWKCCRSCCCCLFCLPVVSNLPHSLQDQSEV